MTDHAAEAREALDAWGVVPLPAPGTDEQEVARQSIAVAQVHATLALADEQRTANLIATVRLCYGDGQADLTRPWDGGEDTAEWRAVRNLIATRLGLTPTTPASDS